MSSVPTSAYPPACLVLGRWFWIGSGVWPVQGVVTSNVMMASRESRLWPSEHAEAAIVANPFGRAVIIEGSGHTVSFDQPDRFNEVLIDFLH